MSYTAMLERLERGETDVMLADLSYSRDREERVDFTAPFMNIGVGRDPVVRNTNTYGQIDKHEFKFTKKSQFKPKQVKFPI